MQTRCVPFAKELRNLLRLHNQAEAYGRLPSEILGIESPWGAWQVNEITLMVGRRVEKNLNDGKDAFFGLGRAIRSAQRGYRSAKALVKKTVKIRADGTW
jgi:hypothetical protein